MIVLVEPEERFELAIGPSRLICRRLSLGALAAIERHHATLITGPGRTPPRLTIPPAALEAAICAHALVGWQGVVDAEGRQVAFEPALATRLPAGVRARIVRAAFALEPGGSK